MNLKNPRNHRTSTKKSFNLDAFNDKYYKNEEACKETMFNVKFPDGYTCCECNNTNYSWVKNRKAVQCTKCCKQHYLLSDTIFQDSKLSYYKILLGIYIFVTFQSGISGTALSNLMSVNINTARLFLRKLRQACKIDNDKQILEGLIDLDGDYIGGVDTGGKRGVGSKKQTVMIAVEMIDTNRGYLAPGRANFSLVKSENGPEILKFVKRCIRRDSVIRSDNGRGISVLGQTLKDNDGNCLLDEFGDKISKHNYTLKNSNYDKNAKELEYVHKFISNFERMVLGTYHGVDLEYVEELLHEYTWRYNNRTVEHNMVKVYSLLSALYETESCTIKEFAELSSNELL